MVKEILTQNQEHVDSLLYKTDKGWPYGTIDNAMIILENDELFKGHIRENLFRDRIELSGEMPWPRFYQDITDKDVLHICYYLEKYYHFRGDKALNAALQIVATKYGYHPVREYLMNLKWDGVERVRYALPHFLGTSESDYEYECIKLFMLGAISRIFKPGCKFEYMLCLVGGQGAGKSTFIRFLCLDDRWFTDDIKRLDDEKVYEHLAGHWICELAEMLAVLNTRYNEATKNFLSKQIDNYRKPYGTRADDIPRQSVFAGTSNVVNFLPLDRSGNRRFLPIMCDASKAEVHILDDEAASRAYIEQMWAEMMVMYGDGKIRLKLPREIEKNLIEYQRPFMQEDTWTGLIQEWLDHSSNDVVCIQQIYNEALKEMGKPRNSESREIGLIMNGTISGWTPYPNPRNIPGYGKQRGWMRLETNSGNSDETFVSVEGTQMEIPFESL
ncbi:MAG: virulence-associated protein E [Oribacterium sp.]|nr:virulence-associated protein E [Oribacterium sp.]